MARQSRQLALPLERAIHESPLRDRGEPPESLLRAAWERSRLKIDFEEAMRLTHFRICLKHLTMSMMAAKGRKSR